MPNSKPVEYLYDSCRYLYDEEFICFRHLAY
jgi:hypothetical protein